MPAQNFRVPAVFAAIDRITAPVRRFQRVVRTFAARAVLSVARVDRVFIKLGRTLNTLAGGFGVTLGFFLLFRVLSHGVGIIADYEQANANLGAVTRATAQEMVLLKKNSQELGATTRFTASEVVGLQTELGKLGFTVPEILAASESILALASATNTELPQAAAQVGSAIRAFGLDAKEAGRVSDVFAAGVSSSALDMEKLNVAMSKVAPVAQQFGFSIENTVALMGSLADAGFDASTMATSTRSIILNLADSNGKLAKALGRPARTLPEVTKAMIEMREKGIDLAALLDLTDKRSVAAAATFLENAESINAMSKAMQEAGGTAKLMALQQMDTLRGSTLLLRSAYEGFIISLETGDGQISRTLRKYIDLASALLGMWTQTNEATGSNKQLDLSLFSAAEKLEILEFRTKMYQSRIKEIAKKAQFWIKVVLGVAAAYVALKAIILLHSGIMAAYAVGVGLVTFATKAWTAAQWLINAALTLNPIGLIIAAIAALIAIVTVIIVKYEKWGAALTLLLGSLGIIINLVMAFRRNWDAISDSFKTGGIINGLKAIGITIADALIFPLEQVANLIKDFTGVDLGATALTNARQILAAGLQVTAGGEAPEEAAVEDVNPAVTRQERFERSVSESVNEQLIKLEIDSQGNASVDQAGSNSNIDVEVQPSFSFAPRTANE